MPTLQDIEACVAGIILIAAITCTWIVQDWRWEAKETAAIKQAVLISETQAKQQAAAATAFEKQRGSTDAKYQKIDDFLNATSGPVVKCLDAGGLRLVNDALSRTAPGPRRPTVALPRPATAN